jgi:exonuclease III
MNRDNDLEKRNDNKGEKIQPKSLKYHTETSKNRNINKSKKKLRKIKGHEIDTRMNYNIGCWNVRTMVDISKAYQISAEMKNYDVNIVGLSETRWNGAGQITLSEETKILFSGNLEEDANKERGVAFMLNERAAKALIEWESTSDRIMWSRFRAKFRNITVINVYAPTNSKETEAKDIFYEQIQAILHKLQRKHKRDIIIIIGDWNAKVGCDNTGNEHVMGKHGIGTINNNGERLLEFCSINNLIIGGTLFQHKDIHKTTWTAPGNGPRNQIDHIIIQRKWRNTLKDVRSMRGADVGSDHDLVRAKLKISLKANYTRNKMKRKYDISKLSNEEKLQEYQNDVEKEMGDLHELKNCNIEEIWDRFKRAIKNTAEKVIGYKSRKNQTWLTNATKEKIEDRKKIKLQIIATNDTEEKKNLEKEYNLKNKEIKRSAKNDKRLCIENLANKAEQAAQRKDMRELYEISKSLVGRKYTQTARLIGENGEIYKTEVDIQTRWMEYFREIYTKRTAIAEDEPTQTEHMEMIDINESKIEREEIKQAIKMLKNGKAAGIDQIGAELIKSHLELSVEVLYILLNKIWIEEKVPNEWLRGIIIKLPKKGNLNKCENWRPITLLCTASKVMTKIIVERMKTDIDKKLRENQAGYRPGRSGNDNICTLRIILEQAAEMRQNIYINFIDFYKAFDAVDRDKMWTIISQYGLPNKYLNMIKAFYNNYMASIEHNGILSEPINIETGVRQGCVMSPILFLMVIDWVMRKTTDNRTGIKWNTFTTLEDLEFADDISLFTTTKNHMQAKTNKLAKVAKSTGLYINTSKTKLLTQNEEIGNNISVDGKKLEETREFCYLGSIVNSTGGTEKDIERRIGLARKAFNSLNKIWTTKAITNKTKLKIFRSNVKEVLLYGAETWKTNKIHMTKIQTFLNKCLRIICNIFWPNRISNVDLWALTGEESIEETITRRKWKWIGHTLRKPQNNITRQALDFNMPGKRRVGRPQNTWKRSIQKEIETENKTWKEVKKIAKDRQKWKDLVNKFGQNTTRTAQE